MVNVPRKAVYISIGYLFGGFASFYLELNESLLLLFTLALLLALSLLLRSSYKEKAMLVLLSSIIAISVSLITITGKVLPLEKLDGETVACEGKIIEATETDSSSLTVSGTVNGIPCKFIASVNDFGGSVGDEISFMGVASAFEDSPFFNSRSYYYTDGIYLFVTCTGELETESPSFSLRREVSEYSRFCSNRIRSLSTSESGNILSAMTLGDTTLISDEARLYMNRVGIGHIISVSGLHVSAAAALVMILLKKLRVPKTVYLLLAEAVVVLYTVFTGFRISCIRAAIMFSVYIISRLINRPSDSLNTVSVAALIIMVSEPFAAADVSLLLSLAGVFAVAVVAPFVTALFKVRSKILSSLFASLCASLITFPAITLFFDEVSLISPLANLLLVPTATIPLYLTMAFCTLGCPFWAEALPIVSGKIIDLIVFLSKELSKISFSYLPTKSESSLLIIALGLFSVLAAVLFFKKKKIALYVTISACAVLCVSQLLATLPNDEVYLDVIVSNGNSSMLLRKDDECIIIDMSGRTSDKHSKARVRDIQRLGLKKTLAVIINNENPEFSYPYYLKCAPEAVLLPENTYVYESLSKQNLKTIPEELECFGLKLRVYEKLVVISDGKKEFLISTSGQSFESDCGLYLIDNLVIYKDLKDTIIYEGDTEIRFRLK